MHVSGPANRILGIYIYIQGDRHKNTLVPCYELIGSSIYAKSELNQFQLGKTATKERRILLMYFKYGYMNSFSCYSNKEP